MIYRARVPPDERFEAYARGNKREETETWPDFHDIHAVLCRKKRTPKRTPAPQDHGIGAYTFENVYSLVVDRDKTDPSLMVRPPNPARRCARFANQS